MVSGHVNKAISISVMASVGPLGELSGMTYDPVKKRYFPTPPSTTKKPIKQNVKPNNGFGAGRSNKRDRKSLIQADEPNELERQEQESKRRKTVDMIRGFRMGHPVVSSWTSNDMFKRRR